MEIVLLFLGTALALVALAAVRGAARRLRRRQ